MLDPIESSALTSAGAQIAGEVGHEMLVYLLGPMAASIVVILMTPPATIRQFAASLISTVFCSIGLGAWVITRYFAPGMSVDTTGAALAGGIYFVCGLPGWFLVKALFLTMEKQRNKSIFDLIKSIRQGGNDE